jgi:RNA polymerase sigma-70 factor (ECF subfamily)
LKAREADLALDFHPHGSFEQESLDYLDLLFGLAIRLCRDRVLAQDLVQETYLKALKARPGFAPGSSLKAWLAAILRNTWRDHCRHSRFVDPFARPEDLNLAADLAARDRSQPDWGDEMEAGLAALPEKQRLVLILACVEEWSYEEIAQALGCPKSSVGVWLKRAKAMLRKKMKEKP